MAGFGDPGGGYLPLVRALDRVLRCDRQDAILHMSKWTLDMIVARAQASGAMLFGTPVEIDDSLPPGIVHLRAETGLDRAIRRAVEDGRSVTPPESPAFDFAELPPPPPTPTLRRLLAHWRGRLAAKIHRSKESK